MRSFYEFHFQTLAEGALKLSFLQTHTHTQSELLSSNPQRCLIYYLIKKYSRPVPLHPAVWDVSCCRCCCSSNCCCCVASSFPAELRHPYLTLFSNMQLWWQVLEFPLKLPVPIVQRPTPSSLPTTTSTSSSSTSSSLSLSLSLWSLVGWWWHPP